MKIDLGVNRIFQQSCARGTLCSWDCIRPAIGVGILCAFFAPLPCLAIAYAPVAELSASDGATLDQFGKFVAVSGDTVLIGAHRANSFSGAAYVYRPDGSGGHTQTKLTPTAGVASGRFGSAVAISGDIAVVTAPFEGGTGAAYVFRYSGSSWVEEDKFTGSEVVTGDYFGLSVALSGDTILVGSQGRYSSGATYDAAYVFRYDDLLKDWVEEAKLTSSDGVSGERFGAAVALSGNTAVVGAYYADSHFGAAYVYQYNGIDSWSQKAKLSAADGAAEDMFASSVAVAGNMILVGAYRNGIYGSAYVYQYDDLLDDWVEGGKLSAFVESAANHHRFGFSVALSGETAVIGAIHSSYSSGSGAAYVFWYNGTVWSEESKLTPPGGAAIDKKDQFGGSVAISGSTILIGDADDDGEVSDSGAAYLYEIAPRPEAKLIAYDGELMDNFGLAVALSGGTALVGAPGDDDNGSASGSAYLFSYDGTNWSAGDKLSASDGAEGNHFGTSVALTTDTAVIGAPAAQTLSGAVYAFHFNGVIWIQQPKLTPSDTAADDEFGASIAISGDTIVVGAPGNGITEFENGPGAAYVFWYNGASWVQQIKLTALDGGVDDRFGNSVAISGDTIVVGALFDDDKGANAGAAYVYQYNGASWIEEDKLIAADGAADDKFGTSVTLSSDTIVVGSPGDDVNGAGAGSAYVFGYDGLTWVEETRLTASDGATVDRFGFSAAISGANTIVIGAEYDDMKGSAYLFWHDGSSWIEEPKIVAPDRGTDYFGTSVSIANDTVLIGAWLNDDKGAAYVSTVQYVNVPEPSSVALNLAALAALALVARRRVFPQ